MLEDMIRRIEGKYKEDGIWKTAEREEVRYTDKETGLEIGLEDFIRGREEGKAAKEYVTIFVSEGDTSDYWKATAANALRPLHQLIAMAKLRPDGVWDGD